eukprot:2993499-Amphidinium_carterae.1
MAQPQLADRINNSRSTSQTVDLFVKSMKSAGLASLLHVDFLKKASSGVNEEAKTTDTTSEFPKDDSAAPVSDMGGRWRRRKQDDKGWTTVQRKTKNDADDTLIDEWSVPVLVSLKMNQPGIAQTDDETQASQWRDIVRNNPHPCAIISKKKFKLDLDDAMCVRVAYHTERQILRNGEQTQVTTPTVGWLHNFNPEHLVTLRQRAQTTTLTMAKSTTVIR